MICLFAKDATDFSTNGVKVLQPVSCIVKEEINGDYSLEITMPQGDAMVQSEMIIRAPTPKNGDQLFRVYKPKVDMTGNNVYQCRHIFYDLLDGFIEDLRPSGDGQAAISVLLSGTGFTGSSDITVQSSAEYQMMNPVKAILGGNDSDDSAFINRWGGEIERDNFAIRMNRHIGTDRGVTIRYRKNLTGLTLTTDMSGVVTRFYPTGRQSDGKTLLTLPEKYADSPLIGKYAHPKIQRIDYSDVQVVDKTDDSHPQLVTEAQAYSQLRANAAAEFTAGIDKPKVSAEVEFIPLESTEEYKNDGLAGLEKVYLGDTVHVFHEPLGIALSAEAVSYEYDCISQRYNSITLGSVEQTIGTVQSTVGKIATGAQQSADKAQTSADTAQQTADDAKKEVELTNITIGKLTVRVTATEEGLEGKVSKDEISSEIQQHPADVIFAFNNVNGSAQSIKFTGDGFDFYNGETLLGHMGVAYDSEASGYEFCVQPLSGSGTYFTNKGGYSLICMGAVKAKSLAADGLISTNDYIQGKYKSSGGEAGKTEDMTIADSSGKPYHMEFKDGLYVAGYY